MRALGLVLVVALGLPACGMVYQERPTSFADDRIQRGKDDLSRGDRAAALAHYEAAAARGDPFGAYKAAQLHAGGPREERDEERAIELLRRPVPQMKSFPEGSSGALRLGSSSVVSACLTS